MTFLFFHFLDLFIFFLVHEFVTPSQLLFLSKHPPYTTLTLYTETHILPLRHRALQQQEQISELYVFSLLQHRPYCLNLMPDQIK